MSSNAGNVPRLFRVGRTPNAAARLPYVIELPVAAGAPVRLASSSAWPEGRDAFCLPIASWPEGTETLLEVPVESCRRSGAAVNLVLQRRQRRRSTFVWVVSRGRTVVFWRTPATLSSARAGLKVPPARGLEAPLQVAVDLRERYAWRFPGQAVTCIPRELPAGDYGVLDGHALLAAVERKTPAQLASDAVSGELAFALEELGRLPRACLVVEGRMSDALKSAEGHARAGWLLNVLAALQAAYPRVPWVFADSRRLAQDYAYRWLAAARAEALRETHTLPSLAEGEPTPYAAALAGAQQPAGQDGLGVLVGGSSAGTYRHGTSRQSSPPAQLPLDIHDRAARLSEAMSAARAGVVWTSRGYATRFAVSRHTAWQDLRELVAGGSLVAHGSRRNRSYRAPD